MTKDPMRFERPTDPYEDLKLFRRRAPELEAENVEQARMITAYGQAVAELRQQLAAQERVTANIEAQRAEAVRLLREADSALTKANVRIAELEAVAQAAQGVVEAFDAVVIDVEQREFIGWPKVKTIVRLKEALERWTGDA